VRAASLCLAQGPTQGGKLMGRATPKATAVLLHCVATICAFGRVPLNAVGSRDQFQLGGVYGRPSISGQARHALRANNAALPSARIRSARYSGRRRCDTVPASSCRYRSARSQLPTVSPRVRPRIMPCSSSGGRSASPPSELCVQLGRRDHEHSKRALTGKRRLESIVR